MYAAPRHLHTFVMWYMGGYNGNVVLCVFWWSNQARCRPSGCGGVEISAGRPYHGPVFYIHRHPLTGDQECPLPQTQRLTEPYVNTRVK